MCVVLHPLLCDYMPFHCIPVLQLRLHRMMTSPFVLCAAGLTSVVLSSIERRYQFTSVMTGLIASTVGITIALCIIPVSYFGGRGHKPRWLGIGAIIHGVGALVFALPQFVVGPYQPSVSAVGDEYCDGEMMADMCSETSPSWVSGLCTDVPLSDVRGGCFV